MILRYNIQVLDVDEAIAELRLDDQAVVKGAHHPEIQVSISMYDLNRLGKFIDWLRKNDYSLEADFVSSTSLDRVYNILC